MSSNENLTREIRASLILEVIGRPPEHLNETLENMIKQMGGEKGVKIVSKKINEPVIMKEQKDFYTNFAEIEVELEEIFHLAILVFKYMPAHLEVISPESIAISNNGWNDILNEITRRLHGYDEIARIMQMQLAQMQKKINELERKK